MAINAAQNDVMNNEVQREQFATRVEQSSSDNYADMDFERSREL